MSREHNAAATDQEAHGASRKPDAAEWPGRWWGLGWLRSRSGALAAWSHAETDADAARVCHEHLRLEFDAIAPVAVDAPLHAAVQHQMSACPAGRPMWADVFRLEALLIRLLREPALRRRVWRLREEYQRLATADLYDAYFKSNPPGPAAADLETVRADAAFLVEEVQKLRVGRRQLESIRAYLTLATVLLAAAGIASVAALLLARVWVDTPLIVLLVGMFGSFFSMMNRLYTIPTKGDLIDRSPSFGRRLTWLLLPASSAAQGMVAAFMMYLLLHAGVGSIASMFPTFVLEPGKANFPGVPATGPDASKLYVWCFVAGFSERLVPDMLSQLAAKAIARETPKA